MEYTAQVERLYLNGRPIPEMPAQVPARRTCSLGPFLVALLLYSWRGPK